VSGEGGGLSKSGVKGGTLLQRREGRKYLNWQIRVSWEGYKGDEMVTRRRELGAEEVLRGKKRSTKKKNSNQEEKKKGNTKKKKK